MALHHLDLNPAIPMILVGDFNLHSASWSPPGLWLPKASNSRRLLAPSLSRISPHKTYFKGTQQRRSWA